MSLLDMFVYSKLLILMAVLTLHSQVHAGRVIGGTEVTPHSRPYMVLLKSTSNGEVKYCSGFLLNQDFVMTAAHCQADAYTANLGVHIINSSFNKQTIPVDQAFPHMDYNQTKYQNDVMILKLKFKAEFNEYVRPIMIADWDKGSLPTSCSVSGWGQTSWNNKNMTYRLMAVNVTLINEPFCEKQNTYCSKGYEGPGKADSGGPLVCEGGKAYGVVSSRVEESPHGPATFMYAKIHNYHDWIISTMKTALMKN